MPSSTRAAAETISAFAALLDAGVEPQRALQLVAEQVGDLDGEVLADTISHAGRQGVSAALLDATAQLQHVPRRFAGQRSGHLQATARNWRRIAAVWGIAEHAGAPLADALRRMTVMLDQMEHIEAESRIAAAGPTATARLLQAMPVFGILLGMALGVDSFGVLFGSPFGWGCLTVAAVLMALGTRWQRRLLATLHPRDDSDGLLLLMVSLGVRAGQSAGAAVEMSERMLTRARLDGPRDDEQARLTRLVALWRRSGVPLLGLLDGQLDELVRARSAALRERAARLETRLLLPLGVCALPAFVVVTVLPMIASILLSTFSSLA